MNRRVVVTGRGVITPIGNDVAAFTESLRSGKSGRKDIQSFDATDYRGQQACEVRDFEARKFGTHLMDPFIQYAVAATDEAIQEAKLDVPAIDPYRIGMSVSSSKGGVHTIDRFKERFLKNPSAILGARIYANSVPNFAAQWIARRWKLQGPAKCYVAACATGTVAIIEGAKMVADGVVDYCIAGASDASIVPLMIAGYRNMKAMALDEIRPFDQRRQGFLAGEGAGIVILETFENAKARGAKIFGEIAGDAYGTDAKDPMRFQKKEHALSYVLSHFLKKSEISSCEIGYVNLHGTATQDGDIYETEEIKRALGERARHIPMSSTKSMTGHMLGAAGAVEAIACMAAMEHGFLPPTINLENPDPFCDLDYIPLQSREARPELTVSISMGFGGHIAVLGIRKI